MSKATIKSIREFIKMYDMEQDIEVIDYDDVMTAPYPDRYVVRHRQFGDPWKTDYLCRTLEDAAHCVNKIIFELPMVTGKSPHRLEGNV